MSAALEIVSLIYRSSILSLLPDMDLGFWFVCKLFIE